MTTPTYPAISDVDLDRRMERAFDSHGGRRRPRWTTATAAWTSRARRWTTRRREVDEGGPGVRESWTAGTAVSTRCSDRRTIQTTTCCGFPLTRPTRQAQNMCLAHRCQESRIDRSDAPKRVQNRSRRSRERRDRELADRSRRGSARAATRDGRNDAWTTTTRQAPSPANRATRRGRRWPERQPHRSRS